MRQVARRVHSAIERTQVDLAYEFRNKQATNLGDKYFAIFSIVENDHGGSLTLVPDYSLGVEVCTANL